MKEKIRDIAKIFAKYKIYPREKCLESVTPIKIFLEMYPKNYYSFDLETFLYQQDYKSEQRGADLPWWGKKYFNDDKGVRVMIVSQDSYSADAGSIVFFASLFDVVSKRQDLDIFTERINEDFGAGNFRSGYFDIKRFKRSRTL